MLCSTISTVRSAETCLISVLDAVDVLVAHALRGLVEQQQLRVQRQRGGDFERALAAVGQVARQRCRKARQADLLQQRHRRRVELVHGRHRLPEAVVDAELALQRDLHVLQHRELREHGRDLERAHDAAARDLRRFLVRDVRCR
jgi:hypothetical protein